MFYIQICYLELMKSR